MQDYEPSANKSHRSDPGIEFEKTEHEAGFSTTPLPVSRFQSIIKRSNQRVSAETAAEVALRVLRHIERTPGDKSGVNAGTHIFDDMDAPSQKIGFALKTIAEHDCAPLELECWSEAEKKNRYIAHRPRWLDFVDIGGEQHV